MEQTLDQEIDAKIQSGIKLSFDQFLSEGWAIFKKTTLFVFLSVIILAIPALFLIALMMPFLFGIYSWGSFVSIVKNDPTYFQHLEHNPVFLLKSSVIGLVFGAAFAPIYGGLVKLCRDADKEGEAGFGALFYYYKRGYYLKLVVIQLIISVIINVLGVAVGMLGPIGGLLNYVIMFLVYTIFIYSVPLIVFKNAGIGEAVRLSPKLVFSNFGPVIGIQLMFCVFSFLGIIACIIGVLFTMAFLPVAQYLLYKHTLGFPEDAVEKEEVGHWQQQPPTV